MFLKKETNSCSRCELSYEEIGITGTMLPLFKGSNGEHYASVNNRMQDHKIEIQKPKEETKMSFFNYDSKQAGNAGFEPVPAGEYEVIISEAKVDTFSTGNRGIKVTLTIRDDVDQEGGKRKVFDNFVESPAAAFKFHNLAKGLEWSEGMTADTLEDYADAIRYQAVRVKLRVKAASGGYEAKNEVVTYLPTQAASHSGGGFGNPTSDPFQNNGKAIDISDDDLPF